MMVDENPDPLDPAEFESFEALMDAEYKRSLKQGNGGEHE